MPLNILRTSNLEQAGLTLGHLKFLLDHYESYDRIYRTTEDTVILPPSLPELPCGLYGPLMGDGPIEESEDVFYKRLNERLWDSRLIDKPMRMTKILTVIMVPDARSLHRTLQSLHAGPTTPRETGELMMEDDQEESHVFWATHALSKDS